MKNSLFRSISVTLAAAILLPACSDDGPADTSGYVIPATFGFYDPTYVNVLVDQQGYDLTVLRSGETEGTAALVVSEDALVEYNRLNSSEYTALSPNLYNISASTLAFSSAESRKSVSVTWKSDDINALDSNKGVVALELVADENSGVSDIKRYVIIHPADPVPVVSVGSRVAAALGFRIDRTKEQYEASFEMDVASVWDVEVGYELDDSFIESYNIANETDYAAVPDGFISVGDGSLVIPAGETSVSFTYEVDWDVFFTGNLLSDYSPGGYLIPVRITSVTNGEINSNNNVMYIPIDTTPSEVKGPWTVLEGEDLCYANQPGGLGGSGWASYYLTPRLFDGDIETEWISWWFDPNESPEEQDNVFPMVFVVDMGKEHVFTEFRIADYRPFHGNYRNYEIYLAEQYDDANTVWTLAADGLCDYTGSATVYSYPPEGGTMNMVAGRYLKFVIVEPQSWSGECVWGRGKLSEVFGMGF